MSNSAHPLDNLKIASPCPANWEEMAGNDRVRFCGEYQLNVYNISNMARKEAEELIQQNDGRLCVRFYQREDGTVMTQNCPVGLKAVTHKVKLIAAIAVSCFLTFLASIGLASKEEPTCQTTPSSSTHSSDVYDSSPEVRQGRVGKMDGV